MSEFTESGLRAKIVNISATFEGAREGSEKHRLILATYNAYRPLPRGYVVQITDHWCATTTSAWAIMAELDKIIPIECSCSKLIALAKKMGIWIENDGYKPEPGDIVLYDWDDDGEGDCTGAPEHIGLVTERSGKSFRVREGNFSNSVKCRSMQVNGRYIRGFICPDYKGEAKRRFDAAHVAGFADVDKGVYYEEALEWAKKEGITVGIDDTHFAPENHCTRAEIVTMLHRFWCSVQPRTEIPFVDVPAGAYYYDAVVWAYDRGVIVGIDDDHFGPDQLCKRAEIVEMIYRLMAEPAIQDGNPFEDVPDGAWYVSAVAWAYEKGIIKGVSPVHFAPGAPVKRCEVVELLYRWNDLI